MNIIHRRTLSRRTLLKGTGISLALPWLEVMSPMAASVATAGGIADAQRPRRAIFCMWGLGINGRDYTPLDAGMNYTVTKILKPVEHLREEFTVISGLRLTHSGGHEGDRSFLTGTGNHLPDCKLRMSADQELAERVGKQTRFPSLVLGIRRGTSFGNSQDNTLSWSRGATPIPAENRPHILFDKLFRPDTPADINAKESEAAEVGSVLDAVGEQARALDAGLGAADRRKLDEYFSSIRDVERRIAVDRDWLHKPKPTVAPLNFGKDVQALDPELRGGKMFDYRRYQRLMYDVIALALQTDSTRVISYMARKDLSDGTYCYGFLGNPYGYHELTHHAEDPEKLSWLTKVDTWYMEDWAYFIEKLRGMSEGDGTLLDHTMLVWGSSGGALNAHNNTHLPTMLVGGQKIGIKHQGHLIKEGVRLGSLWQTMFGVMGAPLPENFQGGEADGIIKELV